MVANNFSMLFPPNGPGMGQTSGVNATGLGDISLFTQRYMLNPKDHPFGNVALGIGMKVPTGNDNIQGDLPNLTGTGFMRRAVYPPAIMPGDGGTGIIVGINGYKNIRKNKFLRGNTVFASATYLANPRGVNGTNSIVASEGVPLAPQFLGELKNAVTDSYNAQIGTSFKLPRTWDNPKLKPFRGRLTFNCEGIPDYNLFGRRGGYRQPGYIMSVAPGFTYAKGKDLFICEVPIVFSRYINARKSAIPDLNLNANGVPIIAPFDPTTQLGMVPAVAISMRYVRSF